MSKTVLFSPLGGTDPISEYNCYDGALLHIARYYQPDKIYMYMSREILVNHKKDNRYLYCLDKLYEGLGKEYDYEIVERPDLVNVQNFNYFYFEFKDLLVDIRKELGDDNTLIINVSSGTPAMKSALMVLSTLGQLNCKTIQVSTPNKGMNQHQHGKEDVRDLWEINPDNEADAANRCEEVECPALDIIQQENYIKKMLRKYDYSAALEIANELPVKFTREYIDLLDMAASRIMLDFRGVDAAIRNNNAYEIAVRNGNERALFEYVLILDVKVKCHEYADFIRAISPLILELFIRVLKKHLDIDIDYYCSTKEPLKWDERKLRSDEKGKKIMAVFNDVYATRGGFRYGGVVYAEHLKEIAEVMIEDAKVVPLMQDLRKVEEKVRNLAAHTMVSITDKEVEAKSGFTSSQIMKKIKELCIYAGLNIKAEQWNDYDRMNDVIIEKIRHAQYSEKHEDGIII